MREEAMAADVFTDERLETIATIWTRSHISLMDVRFQQVTPQYPLVNYRMPSSMLVYVCGDGAQIGLNESTFGTERFGMVHGGKGTLFSIVPERDSVKVFLVFYKAELPRFFKKDVEQLLAQINPFMQRYGFTPHNPLGLLHSLQQMLDAWHKGRAMDRLHAKTLLYQVMHGIYRELENGQTRYLQPDPAVAARQYLDAHYQEPIMFQEIARMFGISGGQLTRLFKKREGVSLQDYLIGCRLEAARHDLLHTEASIREIAASCGLSDEKHLFRMFRKYDRMTPSDYRKIKTLAMPGDDVDNNSHRLYNGEEPDTLVKTHRDGAFTMFGQRRSKEMILAAAMSVMLLLSACTAQAPVNNGAANHSSATQTQGAHAEQVSGEAGVQTRSVTTIKGEVEVPVEPQRVIIHYLMGDAVAMGVTPIAVSNTVEHAVFASTLQQAELLDSWEFDLEDVLALEPDLIITVNENQYEDLAKIAPTIFVPYGSMTTEERVTFMGEILNKAEEAQAALADYAAAIESGKQALEEAGMNERTVSAVYIGENLQVAGNKHAVGAVLYNELGLQAPEAVHSKIIDAGEYWGSPSMEVIADFSGDHIFQLNEVADNILNDNEIWQSIPAVQHGNLTVLEPSLTYHSDILTSTALVNTLVERMLDRLAD